MPGIPVTQASIDTSGHVLAFAEAGAGPGVVLLHGTLTLHQDMMIALGETLAADHHVVAFDRPGHGGSTRPPSDGSLSTQARLLVEAMEGLGLERPILVGHSAGGSLALAMALRFPEALAGVVALAPLVFPEPRLEQALFGARGLPWVGGGGTAAVLRPSDAAVLPVLWNAMFAPQRMPEAFAAGFPFADAAIAAELRATGEDALALGLDLAGNIPSYPACGVPVRILGGSADIVVNNAAHGRMLSLMLPDGRFEAIEGMGHMLHHFAQPRIAATVRDLQARQQRGDHEMP
jgi:pimeloyl-ACP methyl ester carboxylesterase